MTESEIIDEILRATRDGRDDSDEVQSSPNYRSALKVIAGYQFIRNESRLNGRVRYRLLEEKGHQVLDAGGFDKWKARNVKRENEIHQATLDTAKATVNSERHAKQSKRAAWVASGVAALTLTYAVIQSYHTNKQDESINVMRVEIDTLKSQLKALSRIPKAIEVTPQTQRKK